MCVYNGVYHTARSSPVLEAKEVVPGQGGDVNQANRGSQQGSQWIQPDSRAGVFWWDTVPYYLDSFFHPLLVWCVNSVAPDVPSLPGKPHAGTIPLLGAPLRSTHPLVWGLGLTGGAVRIDEGTP